MNISRQLIAVNHSPGRYLYPDTHQGPQPVNKITLHTMDGYMAGTLSTFRDKSKARSSHYGISVKGEVVQYVSEGDTAWANSDWIANVQSVTIEHEDLHKPTSPRPDALYAASIELIADICRRYRLNETSLHLHREYAPGKSCPGTLDVERIKKGVAAALGQVTPVPKAPTDFVEFRRDVKITLPVLKVRTGPGTGFPDGQANTPDGSLHAGTVVTISGYKVGENVRGNAIWFRSIRGNWFWSGGTNFIPNAPTPIVKVGVPATPVRPPVKGTHGTVTVTAWPSLSVRTGPSTNFPVNLGPYPSLKPGTKVQYSDAVHGGNVGGNDIWLKSVRGHWFWSGGTTYGHAGKARVAVSMATGVLKRVQGDITAKFIKS